MAHAATASPIPPSIDNPFDNPLARKVSGCAAYCDNTLVGTADNDEVPVPLLNFIHDAFRALILNPQFSCVGAKSAIRQGGYRIGNYDELGSVKATAGLAYDL